MFKTKRMPGVLAWFFVFLSGGSFAKQDVQIGLVGVVNSSFYQDADEQYFVVPVGFAEYKGFYLDGINAGYRFGDLSRVHQFSVELRPTFDGYLASYSDALAGMSDRDETWEAGLAYKGWLLDGQVSAKLMYDILDVHQGFSANLDYESSILEREQLEVSLYVGAGYWNQDKTHYYFGVEPNEVRAGREAYQAKDSYSVYLGANLFKDVTSNVTLLASTEYISRSSAVKDSPITAYSDSWLIYAGALYKF